MTYNEGLGSSLKAVVTRESGKSLVKKEALDVLASFNTREAADILAGIAKDDNQPKDIRGAAILAVRRMESGIGTSVLSAPAPT